MHHYKLKQSVLSFGKLLSISAMLSGILLPHAFGATVGKIAPEAARLFLIELENGFSSGIGFSSIIF